MNANNWGKITLMLKAELCSEVHPSNPIPIPTDKTAKNIELSTMLHAINEQVTPGWFSSPIGQFF